jgi:GT2 family glycosyltransferase
MTPVIIQLVTWNGEKYIPHLFQSLRAQNFSDWELLILDNGSTDRTVELINAELATLNQPHTLIQKEKNIGFAPGHNELFRLSIPRAHYILLLNQDMCLNEQFVDKLYYFFEAHPDAGSISGRLMKWAFPEKTNIIDSLGLQAFKNHRVVDMNGAEVWRSIDDDVEAIEVFGVSGALPMYRTTALRDVIFNDEVFDKDFFSYKEDVDLAWRLREAGWFSFSVLDAVTHHDRSASGPANLTDTAAAENRVQKSGLANYYSYRNHLMMLVKNYRGEGGIRSLIATIWYELKKAGYLLLFAPRLFVSCWRDVLRLLPTMLRKRGYIERHLRVTRRELDAWFV